MLPQEERSYVFDNVKAVLILLVVFGHALELALGRGNTMRLYAFIYLFHMPLFIFCSGYFAKYKPAKLLTKLIGSYVVFQILYTLFDGFVLGNAYAVIQFTTPYWHLWYLFALIAWMLFLPLVDSVTNTKRSTIFTLCAVLALGVIAGFDNTLGPFMSLSRIVYFFPFFVIGFCVKKTVPPPILQAFLAKRVVKCAAGLGTGLILLWLFFHYQTMDIRWLWGSFSFERLGYTGYSFTVRILLYLAALVISLFVLSLSPRKKTFFSHIGQRTLPVFLLHGFVLRLLGHYQLVNHIPEGFPRALFLAAVSLAIVALFSIRVKKMRAFF